jgi:hypothetical protein
VFSNLSPCLVYTLHVFVQRPAVWCVTLFFSWTNDKDAAGTNWLVALLFICRHYWVMVLLSFSVQKENDYQPYRFIYRYTLEMHKLLKLKQHNIYITLYCFPPIQCRSSFNKLNKKHPNFQAHKENIHMWLIPTLSLKQCIQIYTYFATSSGRVA